jgi:CYTH domain-containing protein
MALEIERRFLVRAEDWRAHVCWQAELSQGYLVDAGPGLTLRVRLSERPDRQPEAWLTIKAPPPAAADGPTAALTRLEYEYPIPLADARGLLTLAGPRVCKRRHGLDLAGGEWVVDVFAEANAPLVVAEVELASADAPLVIPAWCGREITGRHDLSNAALARHPLEAWSVEARRELLAPLAAGGSTPELG